MKPMDLRIASLFIATLFVGATSRADETDVRVTVELLPNVELTGPDILLRDVAMISGGTEAQSNVLGSVDLARWEREKEPLLLSRSQIDLRLRLAGLSDIRWQIRGATQVVVSYKTPASLEAEILQRIRETYAELSGLPLEDIDIQLTAPIPAGVHAQLRQDGLQFVPDVESTPRWGRHMLRVRAVKQESIVSVVSVAIHARQQVECLIANRNISSGTPLSPSDFRMERRLLDRPEHVASSDELQDGVAAVTLSAGQPLLRRAIRISPERLKPVVTARSEVRVVAQRGGLRVVLADGQALQSGHVGDSIRIRNPRSGQIVTAKVVSATEVHVPF